MRRSRRGRQDGHSSNWGGRRPGAFGRKQGASDETSKSQWASSKSADKSAPTDLSAPTRAAAQPKETAAGALNMTDIAAQLPEILAMSERYARKPFVRTTANNPFQLPVFPTRAMPPEASGKRMAMDTALTEASSAWLSSGALAEVYGTGEGLMFPGYNYLAELAQRPEYRVMSETIADDATRKWVKFEITGTPADLKKRAEEDAADPTGAESRRKQRIDGAGKAEKVKQIKDYLEKIEARDRFYNLVVNDGFFGRSHLYMNFGQAEAITAPTELATPIGDGRDEVSRSKVTRDHPLKSLRVIEPIWTYPMAYNANNPLLEDWYNPQVWYVMGTEIHVSRIIPFLSRPVSDILKPAYAFGGQSLSQLAEPYVNIWLKTRQSVAEIIHSFSVMVLSTDMSTMTAPGSATNLLVRMAMFNALRDNQGAFVINEATEDFTNVSAPLGTLDALQAQAQEHMSSVSRIPLVKLTGISPKGLNASSEGEIRVYYDTIAAFQNRAMRPRLTPVINFVQLSLFGEIDPEITYEFESLYEMSQKEKSEKEKADAERDDKYVTMGALDPGEVRKRIIDDPSMPYADLDPDDVPEPPADEGGEGGFGEGGPEGGGGGAPPSGGRAERPEGQDSALAAFDEWKESDHPRAQSGKFGAGGGGKAKPEKTVTVYHGTSDKYLASIKKGGLKPGARRGADRWLMEAGGRKAVTRMKGADGKTSAVYVAKSADDAEAFAMGTAEITNGVPVVLKLKVPKSQFDKAFRVDPRFGKGALRTLGSIPPEWIVEDDSERPLSKDEDTVEVFLVAIPEEDGEEIGELEGGAEDGNPFDYGAFDASFREEDHPRAPDGKFGSGSGGAAGQSETSGGTGEISHGAVEVTDNVALSPSERRIVRESVSHLVQRAAKLDASGAVPDTNVELGAINFIAATAQRDFSLPASERKNWQFSYGLGKHGVAAAGALKRLPDGTAEVQFLGSLQGGTGKEILRSLENKAKNVLGANQIRLTSSHGAISFYERQGYKPEPGSDPDDLMFVKNLDQANDSTVSQ